MTHLASAARSASRRSSLPDVSRSWARASCQELAFFVDFRGVARVPEPGTFVFATFGVELERLDDDALVAAADFVFVPDADARAGVVRFAADRERLFGLSEPMVGIALPTALPAAPAAPPMAFPAPPITFPAPATTSPAVSAA
jgi:hypothetical protein